MTDLSEFGGGIDRADVDEADASGADGHGRGRCRAIVGGGRRCRNDTTTMVDGPFCSTHGRSNDTTTIDAGVVGLIQRTAQPAGNPARCRAVQVDRSRCTNGAGPLSHLCGMHERAADVEVIDRADLAANELDVDRIREAVHALVGLEDEPLRVDADGLHLPRRFAEASRVIIRTPTATIDSRLDGGDRRQSPHPTITPGKWDADYLEGEGRTAAIRNDECLPDDGTPRVGLKMQGGGQHWFPVDLVDDRGTI